VRPLKLKLNNIIALYYYAWIAMFIGAGFTIYALIWNDNVVVFAMPFLIVSIIMFVIAMWHDPTSETFF